MPPTFCPQCNEPLGRPREGAPLLCPVCSTVIAPASTALTDAPPSPPAQERRGEPKCLPVEPKLLVARPLGRAWRRVYLGLGLLKWGTVAALAALAFHAMAVLAAPGHGPAAGGLPAEDHLGLAAVALLSVLSAVLNLLGRLCCCSAPAETGARLPAVLAFLATLLAQVLAGFIVLTVVLVALEAASPFWLLPALLASGSAGLLAEALFLVFLYQVGRAVQEPAVRRRTLGLVMGAALVVLGVVFAELFLATSAATFPEAPGGTSGAAPPTNRALLTWLVALAGVALVLLFYFDLITLTRHVLARRFARDAAARQAQPG